MKQYLLSTIRLYQKFSRHKNLITQNLIMTGGSLSQGSCRFTPTCSEYSYQAIERYGIVKGVLLSVKRISKCHPWSKGGHDPIPSL